MANLWRRALHKYHGLIMNIIDDGHSKKDLLDCMTNQNL